MCTKQFISSIYFYVGTNTENFSLCQPSFGNFLSSRECTTIFEVVASLALKSEAKFAQSNAFNRRSSSEHLLKVIFTLYNIKKDTKLLIAKEKGFVIHSMLKMCEVLMEAGNNFVR